MFDRFRFCFGALALSAAATTFTACTNQRVADEASIAESKKAIPPTMFAETNYFDGQVLVEVTLGRSFRPRMIKAGTKSRSNENAFATTIYSDEESRRIAEEEESDAFIPRMRNSTLPPVALRLRVSNLTQAPIEIGFVECKSYLGNFAVRPEKATIAAGESAQAEPMVSLLGVSGGEIPVTVTLTLGDKRESHTIVMVPLKTLATPKPEAAPPAKP